MFTSFKCKTQNLKRKTTAKILKVLIILLSLYTLHFTLYTSPVYAQSSTSPAIPPQPTTYNLPTTVSPTSPLYTDLLIHNIFHTFSCLGIGQSVIGQPCLTYQMQRNAQGLIEGVPILSSVDTSGGVLGTTTSLIGLLYTNRPVRTADYLASIGEDLGIVKVANAQVVGSGAKVLNPIVTLWQVSRNISYVVMIIIFVIIGLMVMFRTHINPQTVITAQAALPGLVIGLILITFSYFLAGLISDTAFVGTNVVGYYFAAAQGPAALADPDRINLAQRISGESVLRIFGTFVGIVTQKQASEVFNLVLNQLTPETQATVKTFVGFLGAQMTAPFAGAFGPYAAIAAPIFAVGGGLASAFDFLGGTGWLLHLIAVFVLLYAMLRLLLRLVNSFLTIIFFTISAPFQFLFASLPGRQGIATDWIRSMLGNILVFPAVIAVFYFVTIILAPIEPRLRESTFPLKVSGTNQIQDKPWDYFPPKNNSITPVIYAQEPINIIDKTTFPLFGGLDLSFIKILLAFGALVALPVIPDIVIRAVGKASEAGQLIGQELGGNVRTGQGYASQHGSRITQTGQSLFPAAFGERTFYKRPGGGFDTVVQKAGIIHLPEKFGWKKGP